MTDMDLDGQLAWLTQRVADEGRTEEAQQWRTALEDLRGAWRGKGNPEWDVEVALTAIRDAAESLLDAVARDLQRAEAEDQALAARRRFRSI